MCVQEIEADPKKKGKFKPYHTIICCCVGHAAAVDSRAIQHFKSLYGEGTERQCVGLAQRGVNRLSLDPNLTNFDVAQSRQEKHVEFDPATSDPSLRKRRKRLKELEPNARTLEPYFVETSEYPDNYESKLINTTTGVMAQFDPMNPKSQVVMESEGLPISFMQFLLLCKVMVLCFYDTGAQMSLT